MNDLHFLRPDFLYVLIPVALLAFFYYRSKRQTTIWNKICSADLIPHILARKATNSYVPSIITLITLSLLTIGLAGPTWQQYSIPLSKQQSGLVIALDLSNSMNAEDVKPSRLQRALYKISDILDRRQEGQTALIVFSENPFVVTPLTDDIATIRAMLSSLDTSIMPTSGHVIHHAIEKASEMLQQSGISDGAILLITSEMSVDDMEKSITAASQVDNGTKVFVLGVGSEGAAPIPKPEGGFYKDSKGNLMMSMLSTQNLKGLAQSTNGTYVTITADDQDVEELAKRIASNNSSTSLTETDQAQTKWLDQGYLLVLCALPLFLLVFRRGALVAILFMVPQIAQAYTFNDLWKTPDQQAEECFHQKDYQQAKELFEDREWQAATHYHLGDYDESSKIFESNQSIDGVYNYGTARAKLGDYEAALDAYNKVLELQPDHEDALYNKKIIEEYLEQQEKQDQDQDQDQDENDDNKHDQSQDGQKKKQNKEKNKKDKNGSKDKDKDAQDQENDQQESDQQDASDNDTQNKQSNDKNEDDQESDKQDQQDESDKENKDEPLTEEQVKDLCDQYRDQMDKELHEESDKSPEKEEPENLANAREKNELEEQKNEQQRIDDCWLQRVEDDPGGLLRRKFLLQYQQQHKARERR